MHCSISLICTSHIIHIFFLQLITYYIVDFLLVKLILFLKIAKHFYKPKNCLKKNAFVSLILPIYENYSMSIKLPVYEKSTQFMKCPI